MPKILQQKKRPFIVIEALDAGGSQTQTDRLVAHLKREKYKPHQFHFPQEDLPTGRFVYGKFLMSHNRPKLSGREQALIYIQDFYSQADNFQKIINEGGKKELIVSDRYCTSTMAYQTINLPPAARRSMLQWLMELCWEGEPRLPRPDMVVLLDTPVEVSLKRLTAKKKDFFENKQKLAAIRRSYLQLAKEQKWVIINSIDSFKQPRSRQDIHAEVWGHVKKII